jgi:rare lipoprotein A
MTKGDGRSAETAIVVASWYGSSFHGRRTASGQVFDQERMTAAHKTLPFGTRLRVTNLRNGRSVLVTVTDRGPYVRNRQLDVSLAAARRLGLVGPGTAPVLMEKR